MPADCQPTVLRLPQAAPARVLACGAWLKNTACLLDGDLAYLSPLHGDLATVESRQALQASVAALLARASGPLDAVAHDLHPDFYSTELALQLSQKLGVPAIGVQHHHAHLAQVAAEQVPEGALLGWALDGVGLGTDQTVWGGELLWLQGAVCERVGHLPALQLPGGDAASREPWRMAVALLHRLELGEQAGRRLRPLEGNEADPANTAMRPVPQASLQAVLDMLQRGLNCPLTTSGGRWFDAVAALLGLCWWQQSEAQAALALQHAAERWFANHHRPAVDETLLQAGLNLDPLVHRLLQTMDGAGNNPAAREEAQGEAAALFHGVLAEALARAALQEARRRGVGTVVLGGGCFLNPLLREGVSSALAHAGLRVCVAQQLSVGDAGLALGQAWVAAHRVAQPNAADEILKPRSQVCV